MAQTTYSVKLKSPVINKLEVLLKKEGFEASDPKTEYEVWRARSSYGTAVLYKSNKFVLQGKDVSTLAKKIDILSGNIIINNKKEGFINHIGVDEAGKGDYFGSMVSAAAFVTSEDIEFLTKLGVGDSKKISDRKILIMYEELIEKIEYKVDIISPKIYNTQHKEYKNVAIMLAKAHSRVIEGLLEELAEDEIECKQVKVDQFSPSKSRLLNELGPMTKKTDFQQFHKGERDIAIATASIIARAVFLHTWDELNAKWDMDFPKGATNVIPTGKAFVIKHGVESLPMVSKVSFRTTDAVLL